MVLAVLLGNNDLIPWGIRDFDSQFGGLGKNLFNMVRSCDHPSGIAAVGHFLAEGLGRNETVALVSFDNPHIVFSAFSQYGFSFSDSLANEQLIYLYYKPTFSHALSFATDYQNLFGEILRLTDRSLARLAFFNADNLFNLETAHLARASAHKLVASTTASFECSILGHCLIPQGAPSRYLDEVCNEYLPSYLEITHSPPFSKGLYSINWRRSPYQNHTQSLIQRLVSGQGYVNDEAIEVQIA